MNKSITIETPIACMMHCLAANGCIATNFLVTGTQQCELITETKIHPVSDGSSDLYEAGM